MKKIVSIYLVFLIIFSSCTKKNNLIPYRKGVWWGYCDSKKQIIIPCIYDNARTFKNGIARVQKGNKFGFIDNSGKLIIPIIYDRAEQLIVKNNFILVVSDGKYGLIDCSGKQIMPLEFNYYTGFDSHAKDYLWYFSELPLVQTNNKKCGFIDSTGKEVIPFIYDDAWSFAEGLAKVRVNSKIIYYYLNQPLSLEIMKEGFIDKDGKQVIPCMYESSAGFGNDGKISISSFEFHNGRIKIQKNKNYGYMNKLGNEIIPCTYESASDFNEGYAFVSFKGNNEYPKYGVIDTNGNQIVQFIYDFHDNYSEALAKVCMFYKPKEKYGYIDTKGNQVIPVKYDKGDNFHDGLAFVTLDEQSGFINQKGEEVIKLNSQYSKWEFSSFEDGLCMVLTKRGNFNDTQKVIGYIDKNGTQYWEE